MVTPSLKGISSQITKLVENLAFNGLNLVTDEIIRNIEMLLQNASMVNAYRLAVSLRYLHVELKRFLAHEQAFDLERYVFYLGNCWLLSRAFLSDKLSDSDQIYHDLMGTKSSTQQVDNVMLRPVGIEKVYLEGNMFGFIVYLMIVNGTGTGTIVTWNFFQQPRGPIDPEVLLAKALPNTKPAIYVRHLLGGSTIHIDRATLIENSLLSTLPESKITVDDPATEKAFAPGLLEPHMHSWNDIINKLEEQNHDPFDLPKISLGLDYITNVMLTDYHHAATEGDHVKVPIHVFSVEHNNGYPIIIQIPEKPANKALISKMKDLFSKKVVTESMLGKLFVEQGRITFLPISIHVKGAFKYPSLAQEVYLAPSNA